MELALVGLVVLSSLLGIALADRSGRRVARILALAGLSCLALGAAAFFAIATGTPLPAHPYMMGIVTFLLLVVAGALLPFALIGLWKTRSGRSSS